VTYKAEVHPGYCKEGLYLGGLGCKGCSKRFVQDRREAKTLGENVTFRPTSDRPIYCCVNIEKDGGDSNSNEGVVQCKHALCVECFRKGITEKASTMDGSRPKRKRGVVRQRL
jgi:hypothetical protein